MERGWHDCCWGCCHPFKDQKVLLPSAFFYTWQPLPSSPFYSTLFYYLFIHSRRITKATHLLPNSLPLIIISLTLLPFLSPPFQNIFLLPTRSTLARYYLSFQFKYLIEYVIPRCFKNLMRLEKLSIHNSEDESVI